MPSLVPGLPTGESGSGFESGCLAISVASESLGSSDVDGEGMILRSLPAVMRRPFLLPKASEVALPEHVITSGVPSARRQIVRRGSPRFGVPEQIQSKLTTRRSFLARRLGAMTSLIRVTRRVSPGSCLGLGVREPEDPPFIRVPSRRLEADSRQPLRDLLNSGAPGVTMPVGVKRPREVCWGSGSEILPVS